ncbi:MAG: GDSL-type esterase/lipase family protein [Opitutaceae bacterium]
MGDSITAGAFLPDPAVAAYPARLGRLLGPDWDVRNFGVSATTLLQHGDHPYEAQPALPEALGFRPDVVVIALGTNDSKHPGDGSLDSADAPDNWAHRGEFVPDYEALIVRFRQANPAAKIYVCLPPPAFPGRWGINGRTIHDEIIPLIRQVAQKTQTDVIDLYTPFEGRGARFGDSVHPDAEGARMLATVVYRALTGHEPPERPLAE